MLLSLTTSINFKVYRKMHGERIFKEKCHLYKFADITQLLRSPGESPTHGILITVNVVM